MLVNLNSKYFILVKAVFYFSSNILEFYQTSYYEKLQIRSDQSLSRVQLFETA